MLPIPISSSALAPSRSRAFFLVAAVFVFFFSAYVLTASGDIFSTGDTTIRMQLAENYLGHSSPELHGWQYTVPHHQKNENLDPRISLGRGGKTYSTYLPGQPVAMIPFDLIGSRLAVRERWPYGPAVAWFDRLVGPLFGALEVTVFFLFAARIFGVKRSALLTAIFGFATVVWPDEQSVLEHGEVAFFLLLAAYFAFRWREHDKSSWYLVWAGASVGGAAITRYQDALIAVLAIGLYVLLPGKFSWLTRIRGIMLAGLGLAPFVAIDLWYDWLRFGTVLATGHREKLFGYPLVKGFLGLSISPGKGLIWYCPTLLLLIFAGPAFVRRYRAFSVAIATMVLGLFLLYSQVTFWHGDPAWGPRYLYPAVPFLTLPLGELLVKRTRMAPFIWAAVGLVVAGGLVIQLSAIAVNPWRSWYKVIAYEENQGQTWQWVASRYRYFWNVHESPLNFQVRGLYQMAYDDLRHSTKYEIVPPDEDPVLSRMTSDFALNQWNVWWASNEFSWWMGKDNVALAVFGLLCMSAASGLYVTGEVSGGFSWTAAGTRREPLPEAA